MAPSIATKHVDKLKSLPVSHTIAKAMIMKGKRNNNEEREREKRERESTIPTSNLYFSLSSAK